MTVPANAELLARLEERISAYNSLLGELRWKPSRSHIETARNLMQDAADILRTSPRVSANAEMLPCPFCNGPASLHKLSEAAWQIECASDQDCLVCVDVRGPLADIIKAWNTRTSPRSDEVREALVGVNKFLNKIADLIDDEDTYDPLDDAIKWANEALEIMAALSDQPARQTGQEARRVLTEIAAECHRTKWQFELDVGCKLRIADARGLIRKSFAELHRIGDLALKHRDAITTSKEPDDGEEGQKA